jgi:3'-phosphoadenosine 5'-phosphosulfate sulfotransferase (PAPS reductase)/FAD synthetase
MTPEEAIERIGTRRVVVSVSGGRDSAATSLYLTELGIPHDRVFADTGWENALTYEYLRGPLTAKLGPIVEVRALLQMRDLVRKKGIFPSRVTRFCTTELKMKPLRDFINTLEEDVVNVWGIRAAESIARSKFRGTSTSSTTATCGSPSSRGRAPT